MEIRVINSPKISKFPKLCLDLTLSKLILSKSVFNTTSQILKHKQRKVWHTTNNSLDNSDNYDEFFVCITSLN